MSTQMRRTIISPPENNRRRSRNILYATIAIVAILIALAIVFGPRLVSKSASEAPVQAPLKVGDAAPQFSVSSTGGPVDLAAVSGQPVFLEVFATWCPHCQNEVKTLNTLYKKYGTRVKFVSVSGSPDNIDRSAPESQLDVIAFAQKFGVEYPIAYDPTLDVGKRYLQGGFPTFVVIDKTKHVAYINSGELPPTALVDALEKTLK